jgi:hypothetical protein
MLDLFAAGFRVIPEGPAGEAWHSERLASVPGYAELSDRFAGCTFESGLYRLHDTRSGPRGEGLIAAAFSEFAERACPFGYDWLGRQFAVDARRGKSGDPLVLMLEPGTGEALEIPFTLADFHEQLIDLREPALAAGFFEKWARANPASIPLRPTDCAGYRVPLFLGGKDTVENLEVIDMEVYWSVCGELRQGTRHLPAGTSIGEVSTSD